MLNNILSNIEASNQSEQKKKEFINITKNLMENKCPVILDEHQLKLVFNIDSNSLSEFMKKSTNKHIIMKRKNGFREIWKPDSNLKEIQRWILKKLLVNKTISQFAHGFVKDKSIVTNAKVHVHPAPFWVASYDIENFFPSIKIEYVTKIFLELGYSFEVSYALSQLCCINNRLVQGFPTSPAISNIVMHEIDLAFGKFAEENSIDYSRYADDISFSGLGNEMEAKLKLHLNDFVESVLATRYLRINRDKDKIYNYKSPKKITGIIVSEDGLRVPLKLKKFMAKEIYYCKKFGVESHLKRNNRITLANYRGYMYGYAGFIRMVEKDVGTKFFEELDTIYWG